MATNAQAHPSSADAYHNGSWLCLVSSAARVYRSYASIGEPARRERSADRFSLRPASRRLRASTSRGVTEARTSASSASRSRGVTSLLVAPPTLMPPPPTPPTDCTRRWSAMATDVSGGPPPVLPTDDAGRQPSKAFLAFLSSPPTPTGTGAVDAVDIFVEAAVVFVIAVDWEEDDEASTFILPLPGAEGDVMTASVSAPGALLLPPLPNPPTCCLVIPITPTPPLARTSFSRILRSTFRKRATARSFTTTFQCRTIICEFAPPLLTPISRGGNATS